MAFLALQPLLAVAQEGPSCPNAELYQVRQTVNDQLASISAQIDTINQAIKDNEHSNSIFLSNTGLRVEGIVYSTALAGIAGFALATWALPMAFSLAGLAGTVETATGVTAYTATMTNARALAGVASSVFTATVSSLTATDAYALDKSLNLDQGIRSARKDADESMSEKRYSDARHALYDTLTGYYNMQVRVFEDAKKQEAAFNSSFLKSAFAYAWNPAQRTLQKRALETDRLQLHKALALDEQAYLEDMQGLINNGCRQAHRKLASSGMSNNPMQSQRSAKELHYWSDEQALQPKLKAGAAAPAK